MLPSHSVTAVMIADADVEQDMFARASLRCFLEQSYHNRELIILNPGHYRVTDESTIGVEEISVDGMNRGQLWNMAVDKARGDWIAVWEPSDWHHPHRLTFQMAARRPDCSVTLTQSMLIDMNDNKVGIYSDNAGLPRTMLFPRDILKRFQPTPGIVEKKYLIDNFVSEGNYVLLDNDVEEWPGAALHARVWTGDKHEPEYQDILKTLRADLVNGDHAELIQEMVPDYYGVPAKARAKRENNGS